MLLLRLLLHNHNHRYGYHNHPSHQTPHLNHHSSMLPLQSLNPTYHLLPKMTFLENENRPKYPKSRCFFSRQRSDGNPLLKMGSLLFQLLGFRVYKRKWRRMIRSITFNWVVLYRLHLRTVIYPPPRHHRYPTKLQCHRHPSHLRRKHRYTPRLHRQYTLLNHQRCSSRAGRIYNSVPRTFRRMTTG